MSPLRPATLHGALRVALGAFFLLAGVAKLAAPQATAEVILARGIAPALPLGVAAGLVEILGGALLAAGVRVRVVALTLLFLYAPIALVFHDPLAAGGPGLHAQLVNLAFDAIVLGGLVVVGARADHGRTRTRDVKAAEAK